MASQVTEDYKKIRESAFMANRTQLLNFRRQALYALQVIDARLFNQDMPKRPLTLWEKFVSLFTYRKKRKKK